MRRRLARVFQCLTPLHIVCNGGPDATPGRCCGRRPAPVQRCAAWVRRARRLQKRYLTWADDSFYADMQRAHRDVLDRPGPPSCGPARAAPARLQLAGITKRYPAVLACSGVSLTVQPGQIHAVLGENGAGKSTLMKIIYGALAPDAGSMHWNGQAVRLRHPQQARALGIAMVFQHFSLFDSLTVAENVWQGLDQRMSMTEVTGH